MIESLVEQVESRFSELSRGMSDPEVINDRERYAEWFAIEYGYKPSRRQVAMR